MKVFGNCECCGHENSFRTSAETRVQFEMEHGEFVHKTCVNCKNTCDFQANDLKAKMNKTKRTIGLFTLLFGTPFVGIFIFAALGLDNILQLASSKTSIFFILPSAVFFILKREDEARVRAFNNSYLRFKPKPN